MVTLVRSRATRLSLAALFVTSVLVAYFDRTARAQSDAMRWDGLLEGLSVQTNGFGWEVIPADGANHITRHAVSADGRYVLFNSDATNLSYSWPPALYLRDRNTGETRLLLAGPA